MTSSVSKEILSFEEQITQYKAFNQNNFVRLVRETYRQMTNSVNKRLAELGYGELSARHLAIFDHLDYGGTNIITLSNRAGISKQAISKLVKETTEMGFTSVKADLKDSRVVNVSFTEKGMNFLQVIHQEVKNLKEDFSKTDDITPNDVDTMTNTLSKLLTYFELGSNNALLN